MRNIGYQVKLGIPSMIGELAIACMMLTGNFVFIRTLERMAWLLSALLATASRWYYDRQCHRTIGTTHCQLQLRCRSAGEGDAGFPFLHIAGFCMWTVDDIGRHDRKSSDCVAVPFRRNDRR